MKTIQKDALGVGIYDSRSAMGQAAADDVARCIERLLKSKSEINMVFAAAPSQNELLSALAKKDLPWQRINAFHMDEYVGLDRTHPQSFGKYLYDHIFSLVPFGSVHYISDYGTDYAALLERHPIDIVCLGIGENGHIAFNDPGVADFSDPLVIKKVALDEVCRMQQVHDGCFAALCDVPTHALTLTVPQMMSGAHLFCVVPAATKRVAVKRMLTAPVNERVPATVLRRHTDARMYCDADSAALLDLPFSLGIISDEVSQDIFAAAEFAARQGLDAIELRSVGGHGPFKYTERDIEDIQNAVKEYNLSVSCIAAPLFKCTMTPEHIAKQTAAFEKLAVIAERLGAGMIRGFDFFESGVPLTERAAAFTAINDICEKHHITCVIEHDPSLHSTTADELASLLRQIGLPHIRALYDAANEAYAYGKVDADGCQKLKPWLSHIHIKDAVRIDGTPSCVKIGTGAVDYPALFRQLFDFGYHGTVSLETHYRLSRTFTEDELRLPGGEEFSDGAAEASMESIFALQQIIANEVTRNA